MDLLLRQELEVDVLVEERVALDFLGALDTEAARGVAVQQGSEDALRFRRELLPEDERIVQDLLVHLVRDLCTCRSAHHRCQKMLGGRTIVERRKPCKHLVQEHTESPPINRFIWFSISGCVRNKITLNNLTVAVSGKYLRC